VEPAPRLAAVLGLAADALWIKRDDLTGLGGGGNKLRKLRYTGAQALAAGATTLITTGAPQSNHARLTAAVAARLGLRSVLVQAGDQPALQGNLVLERLAGAELAWVTDPAPDPVRREVERQAQRVQDAGGVPYVIPFGGSSSFAALGYVDCGIELLGQVPGLDHVVVAFGSGGTMAGLVASLGAERVIGVDTGAVPDPRATLDELLDGMPGRHVPRAGLQIDDGQVGAGYATLAPGAAAAMRLAARTEGIFLDPTYTARALASLAALTADGRIKPGDRTVFLHTGGLPGLFGHLGLSQLT
jgi:L-cysteate sulfo-lyase